MGDGRQRPAIRFEGAQLLDGDAGRGGDGRGRRGPGHQLCRALHPVFQVAAFTGEGGAAARPGLRRERLGHGGQVLPYKTPNHPHTNMAKASLNMMTRTCAADLAKRLRVYMTAVDTGWINDENPAPKSYRTAQTGFQTPIDEVDAAARILHPVFDGIVCETPLSGVFLKDYGERSGSSLGSLNLSHCLF